MGHSVSVFISHSSEDKKDYIEPIVTDLENCYIHVWIDKKKILPGKNLRKSVFRDGLDQADIALIFFTKNSVKSRWVDREIKHVLKDEQDKGNNFDLNKIISVADSEETYKAIEDRFPELTDDLMHVMPLGYSSVQLGQLISAIWSKYLELQGGDVETQRQLLLKDREVFQKEKDILQLQNEIKNLKNHSEVTKQEQEFGKYYNSKAINEVIKYKEDLLNIGYIDMNQISRESSSAGIAFGIIEYGIRLGYASDTDWQEDIAIVRLTPKGQEFFQWVILNNSD